MAFYLKYRSQTISELDISSVRESLTGILKSAADGNLPHALLFTGPRGTGKTSSARILAKALNCKKTQIGKSKKKSNNIEPCNTCSFCTMITKGSALDVIEIDAASHRRIDDIRELREKVKLAPLELEYKVYIIDEVHMLTTEAFNALLKTLEEPPDNVVFILCTTELHKIPDTIVSRCIKVDFPKAEVVDVIHSLERVTKGEKIKIDDNAIRLIAEQAGGSFRDAHKILEQASWNKDKLTVDDIKHLLGVSQQIVSKLHKVLEDKQVSQAIQLIEQAAQEGKNIPNIVEQLIHVLHNQMIEQVKQKQTEPAELQEVSRLLYLLDRSLVEIKTTSVTQLPVQIAILEWLQTQSKDHQQPDQTNNSAQKTTPSRAAPATASKSNPPPTQSKAPAAAQSAPTKQAAASTKTPVSTSEAVDPSVQHLENRWSEVLEVVKAHNNSLQALLRAARPKMLSETDLHIEVWYAFHLEKLQAHQNKQVIEDAICNVFGYDRINITFVLGNKNTSRKPESNSLPADQVPESIRKPKPINKVQDKDPKQYIAKAAERKREKELEEKASVEDETLIAFAEELFG